MKQLNRADNNIMIFARIYYELIHSQLYLSTTVYVVFILQMIILIVQR